MKLRVCLMTLVTTVALGLVSRCQRDPAGGPKWRANRARKACSSGARSTTSSSWTAPASDLFTGCDATSDFTFTTQEAALEAGQALLDQVFLDGSDPDCSTPSRTHLGM